jgi:hypothetical protein
MKFVCIFVLVAGVTENVFSQNWRCIGQTTSIINTDTNVKTGEIYLMREISKATADTKLTPKSTLLKAIFEIEKKFENETEVPNVCGFSKVLNYKSPQFKLSWKYTQHWNNRGVIKSEESEVLENIFTDEDFEEALDQIKNEIQPMDHLIITTLCMYACFQDQDNQD